MEERIENVNFSHYFDFSGGLMSAQHFLRVDRSALSAFPTFDRDAAALARAKRARHAFQDRLVDTFRGYLEGVGAEPSDSDLRTFALLAAAEYELEQRSGKTSDSHPPKNGAMHVCSKRGIDL